MSGPQSEASRTLSILRASDQLSPSVGVPSTGPSDLENLAEPANPGSNHDLGTLRAGSSPPSIVASSHYTPLGSEAGIEESGLRNRVREFCTLGSARRESESRYGDTNSGTQLETADTDKLSLLWCFLSSTRTDKELPTDLRASARHYQLSSEHSGLPKCLGACLNGWWNSNR